MLTVHKMMGTWANSVDAYIALTGFARQKFTAYGLPRDKVHVKPIFLGEEPEPGDGEGRYALFIGRLVEEKGVRTLLDAWRLIGTSVKLKILGDGPLSDLVEERLQDLPGVGWERRVSRNGFWTLLRRAKLLVVPSLWYEGLPGVIVEALAVGCPVVASKIGSLQSIIEDGRTGAHFKAGDPADLAAKVKVLAHSGTGVKMREAAKSAFRANYTRESNYRQLESYPTRERSESLCRRI